VAVGVEFAHMSGQRRDVEHGDARAAMRLSGTKMMYFLRKFGIVPLAFASACATAPPPPTQPLDRPDAVLSEVYRIGIDDTVQVSVWRNPELAVEVPVRPDGMITMPLIGDVRAGGRTPSQVGAEIKERLSLYIREPEVAVILTELKSNEFLTRVRVTGAVNTPSSLPYRQGMTVLDAILAAGGPSEFADQDQATLYRKLNGRIEAYPIHLRQILTKGDLLTNFELQYGDIITVPERFF
jgi:polysaccharide export outer membrane protein